MMSEGKLSGIQEFISAAGKRSAALLLPALALASIVTLGIDNAETLAKTIGISLPGATLLWNMVSRIGPEGIGTILDRGSDQSLSNAIVLDRMESLEISRQLDDQQFRKGLSKLFGHQRTFIQDVVANSHDETTAALLAQLETYHLLQDEHLEDLKKHMTREVNRLLRGIEGVNQGDNYISETDQLSRLNKYLKQVISDLIKWESRYTPMFAKFEKITLFAQVKNPTSQPEPLLDLINNRQKLVIIGHAGSGKTTTTQKVTLENAQSKLEGKKVAKIPILVSLRDYGDTNIEKMIDSVLRFSDLRYIHIEKGLESGKYLLVFDGLNEVPINRRKDCFSELRRFLKKFPNNRYIFTSRTLEYKDDWLLSGGRNFPVCEIQNLTRDQIESLILRYFEKQKSKAKYLVEELGLNDIVVWKNRRSLARLAGVPLLLQMLILTFEEKMRIPKNEGELINNFIDEILEYREAGKAAGKFNSQVKKQLLANVAKRMLESENSKTAPKRFAKKVFIQSLERMKERNEAPKKYAGIEIWQEIQNNHLLIERNDMVYWPHPLYQELFVGISFKDSCFNDLWKPCFDEIYQRFNPLKAKWYGNPRFDSGITMLEIIPAKYRIQALANVACINPVLSKEVYFKLEPELNPGLQKEFVAILVCEINSPEYPGEYHRKLVRTLGYIEKPSICSPLFNVSKNCPSWEGRDQAVGELWMKCHHDHSHPGVTNHLMEIASKDTNQKVRKTAISKLISFADKTKSSKIILFLMDCAMNEPQGFVRNPQILFPNVLATSISLEKLKSIALNKYESVSRRCRAIWLIGYSKTKNEEMRSALIHLAKNDNQFEVRKAAVDELRHFSSIDTVRALYFVLKHEGESSIREKAVYSLDACKDNYSEEVWLTTISDPDECVGKAAIETLFNIHDKHNALEHFIQLSRSSNILEKNRALDILARVSAEGYEEKAKEAAKELSYHVNAPNKHTRLKIAYGLRGYDVRLSNRIFEELIKDEDPNIVNLAQQYCEKVGVLVE